MAYNKKKLPGKEKIAGAGGPRNSFGKKLTPVKDDEIAFAEARLQMHESNPGDGISWEEVKVKLKAKYGF